MHHSSEFACRIWNFIKPHEESFFHEAINNRIVPIPKKHLAAHKGVVVFLKSSISPEYACGIRSTAAWA